MKLTNITPNAYRCPMGECPTIYTACVEITSCPTVIAKGDTYVIIGAIVDQAIAGIEGKVGEDETAIEIPAVIVNEAVNAELCKRIAELEAALKPFADECQDDEMDGSFDRADVQILFVHCRQARSALSPDKATP